MKPFAFRRFAFRSAPRFAPWLAGPLFAALFLAGCAGAETPSVASDALPASNQVGTDQASLASLVDEVQIPFETFTLDNGLTTIVHTDRKAPIVGVTVYYRVGSRHEPRGRTGFAHLFEHLMFGGSENVPNFDIPLEAAGSTPTNGSTYYDRTNYVETVPTGALDLALFMESDRMGYLLGAVTQEKLDAQRGVVQNEKREGDNQPYGLIDYLLAEGLLPVGHPYRHAAIGSMADLEAASLQDVRDWFTANYGPNNVVLALTGDIDTATARPMVERWFGEIPRGPDVPMVEAAPVTLRAPVNRVVTDQVPQTLIQRAWTGPGLNHADTVPLQVGMYILGGLQSSRLDNAMVRGDALAVSVSAYAQPFEHISLLVSNVNVKDGVASELAQSALEAETTRLIEQGPTADELARAKIQILSGTIASLQRVGGFSGKGMILAENLLYTGDAGTYRKELEQIAALTPADVQMAMQRWLSRPAFTLTVVPGERTLDGANMGGWGDEGLVPPAPAAGPASDATVTSTPAPIAASPRRAPPVAPVAELTFPTLERATLSNGIEVVLARRSAVPQVSLALTIDAGSAVDHASEAGVHETMIDLLTEGTTTRSALDIAIAQERLGSSLSAAAGIDADTIYLTALTTNLVPSLELMADVALNPAFQPEDVSRIQARRLAEIAQQLAEPGGLAARAFMPAVYGRQHPYASASSSGDAQVIAGITPRRLHQEHAQWLRPDLASIVAVGDVSMGELVTALEASYGGWGLPANAAPGKAIRRPAPAPQSRLIVIDRPNSPSSYLMLGRMTPIIGHADGIEAVDLANEVVGSTFLSRLNADLRETKGWTYSVRSEIPSYIGQRALRISTQVQADRTADSIRAIIDQLAAFPTKKPVDPVELQRVTDGNIRGLPNRFETNGQVLGALLANRILGRDERYQAQLPALYRAIDADAINAAARDFLQPDDFTIVVVGDRRIIDEQLATLGMAIEYRSADEL